jgi:hypothetical protein
MPIAEVEAAIATFVDAREQHRACRGQWNNARADIAASLARALRAADLLDVMVSNYLAGNSAVLARWKEDRRVEPPRGRNRIARSAAPTETVVETPPLPEVDVPPAAAA